MLNVILKTLRTTVLYITITETENNYFSISVITAQRYTKINLNYANAEYFEFPAKNNYKIKTTTYLIMV